MGRYHWPGCGKKLSRRGHYGMLLGTLRDLRRDIQKKGDLAPVVLSGGNMMGPDIMGEYILKNRKTLAPKTLKLIKKSR